MPKFEVEFRDGHTAIKDANTADDAKAKARVDRRRDLPTDTPKSASEVLVKRVTQLEDKAKARKSDRDGEGGNHG